MSNIITDYLTTEAKNQIGLLYEAPKILLQLSYSQDPSILQDVNILNQQQTSLEEQVQNPDNVGGDTIKTATFIAAVTYHNNQVASLAKKAGVTFGNQSFIEMYWKYVVGGGIALIVLLWLLKKKN